MTSTTALVASIAGPAFVLIGIGFFVSREHYKNVYQNLQRETLAVFITAMVVFATGIATIKAGNAWDTLPNIIVNLLGWGMILKGISLTVMPSFAERMAARVANSGLFAIVGIVLLILGLYLSAVVYF
ncbi:MAG TPA: hypothetical protein VN086_01945 [Candidatus Paceibacterota bacterium]|nr:hypothetical protein [Candidatus Paceibacterota bacterium]